MRIQYICTSEVPFIGKYVWFFFINERLTDHRLDRTIGRPVDDGPNDEETDNPGENRRNHRNWRCFGG